MNFVGGPLKLKGLKPPMKTKSIKKDATKNLTKEKLTDKLKEHHKI
jgi:hypothetical protein